MSNLTKIFIGYLLGIFTVIFITSLSAQFVANVMTKVLEESGHYEFIPKK